MSILKVKRTQTRSIQYHEIDKTFGTCIGAPGPDGCRGNFLDNADRSEMKKCLHCIWNKAWDKEIFLDKWKEEDRQVLDNIRY